MALQSATHEDFSTREGPAGSSDRVFGLVFTAAFAVIALWPLRRGAHGRWWALAISGAFLLLALAFPSVLHPANRLWSQFGLLLSKVTNPIVLGVMFFFIFTPVAYLCRLLGKDLVKLKTTSHEATYWIPRQPPGPSPESMHDLF